MQGPHPQFDHDKETTPMNSASARIAKALGAIALTVCTCAALALTPLQKAQQNDDRAESPARRPPILPPRPGPAPVVALPAGGYVLTLSLNAVAGAQVQPLSEHGLSGVIRIPNGLTLTVPASASTPPLRFSGTDAQSQLRLSTNIVGNGKTLGTLSLAGAASVAGSEGKAEFKNTAGRVLATGTYSLKPPTAMRAKLKQWEDCMADGSCEPKAAGDGLIDRFVKWFNGLFGN